MYLLDTNVISELRKLKPHGAVLAWLEDIADEALFLSAVTLGELQAGVELTRRQDSVKAKEIERWLDQVAESYQILPMDARAFRECYRIMDGQPEEIFEDAMLAATARVHRLTMVTRNTRHFKGFGVSLLNPFASKAS